MYSSPKKQSCNRNQRTRNNNFEDLISSRHSFWKKSLVTIVLLYNELLSRNDRKESATYRFYTFFSTHNWSILHHFSLWCISFNDWQHRFSAEFFFSSTLTNNLHAIFSLTLNSTLYKLPTSLLTFFDYNFFFNHDGHSDESKHYRNTHGSKWVQTAETRFFWIFF